MNTTKLLNVEETAEILNMKVSTLYAWVHQKKIAHIKAGRLVRFDISDLEQWKLENKVAQRNNH